MAVYIQNLKCGKIFYQVTRSQRQVLNPRLAVLLAMVSMMTLVKLLTAFEAHLVNDCILIAHNNNFLKDH